MGHTAPPEYIQQVGSNIDSVLMYVYMVLCMYSLCICIVGSADAADDIIYVERYNYSGLMDVVIV